MYYYLDGISIYEEAVVVPPVEPDEDDAAALDHIYATGSTKWAGATTSNEVVAYSEEGITKPEGLTGDTLIKYTYTSTNVDASGTHINTIPLRYFNGAQWVLSDEQKALDYSKAEISFYLYNPNDFALPVYLTNAVTVYFNTVNKGTATAAANGWTKITFSLAEMNIDPNGS